MLRAIHGLRVRVLPTAVLLALAAVACNRPNATASNADSSTAAATPAFDVPALVGKNIDQIRKRLGTPVDRHIEPPPTVSTDEWSNEFHHDGRSLLVTYNPKTRQVEDFFVGDDTASAPITDYSPLLPVVNAKESSPDYYIEPVPAMGESGYTGIKIIPTPHQTHAGR